MATNNQNQKSEEPEPFLMPSPKTGKRRYYHYGGTGTVAQRLFYPRTKIMLQLIKISQKLIDYNIRLRKSIERPSWILQQRAAGHIDLCIKLSEFLYWQIPDMLLSCVMLCSRCPNTLLKLAYKLGDQHLLHPVLLSVFECKVCQYQGNMVG